MAIEDFEWQGDVELTRPSQARLAAASELPTGEGSSGGGWLSRAKKSVWVEPALKLLGMALLLAVLAGIGVVATTYAKPGLALPEGSRSLAAALGTSWLKPGPGAEAAPRSVAAAPSTAPVANAGAAAEAPRAGSEAAPAEAAPSGGTSAGITADGRVIINVASVDELTKLPGVGMKRAQAIVALRTKLKRFKTPTDLLRVKGIGPRGLKRMLPHLVLDAP
jgi:competence protein ComEA